MTAMADDLDSAVRLVEEALHLLTHGENAPGGTETWGNWIRKAEEFLRARLAAPRVEIIPLESWRADFWDDDVPSRPGWQVECSEHGLLGRPPGWAYASSGHAAAEATRHRRRHARGDFTGPRPGR